MTLLTTFRFTKVLLDFDLILDCKRKKEVISSGQMDYNGSLAKGKTERLELQNV